MKYSHKWLQEHLGKPLPSAAEELARTITMKSFEVEGVEPHGDDTIFDIKVLPDRAHDALSHRGMAREIAALFDIPLRARSVEQKGSDAGGEKVHVEIKAPEHCPRYIGVRVDGVTVGASPKWLTEKLASVGQRSINNIVDLTNFILFDLGQPMHAFDAEKVAGGITVRLAKADEKMTTLDGKDLVFDGSELVIADDEGVLALAGVKGGKRAEVGAKTTSIIFECANFDPTATRKTSTKHNIKTDASKRYENGMTSELAGEAVELALSELQKMLPAAKIGTKSDVYPHLEPNPAPVSVTLSELNGLLGAAMTEKDVEGVLKRLAHAGFSHETKNGAYVVTPPVSRLDIRIKEDLIEEIGRHYGYDQITPTLPSLGRKGLPNKRFYYANKVRNFLVERGFSEVYTYSFAGKLDGEVEVENPVGKDRPFMRTSLTLGIHRALELNMNNTPILETEDVKLFEIGNVFSNAGEGVRFAMGYMPGSKKKMKIAKEYLEQVTDELDENLGTKEGGLWMRGQQGDYISGEVDFDELIKNLPEPIQHDSLVRIGVDMVYKTLSPYPFIVRDVALWVQKETNAEEVEKVIRANAGELAQKIYLFDTFEKPARPGEADGEVIKSFAFRMVLQSFERTLEDAEANAVYDKVVAALQSAHSAWQVRV